MESTKTLASLAEHRTAVNFDNSLINLIGAFERSGSIFPVSGDMLTLIQRTDVVARVNAF